MNRFFVYEHCGRFGIPKVSLSLDTPHASAECERCENGHDFFEKFDTLDELKMICRNHDLDIDSVLSTYATPEDIPLALDIVIEKLNELPSYTAIYSKNRYG